MVRRDLAYLVTASGLGLAYLLYIDFAIVWFGNLPAHVAWYATRFDLPIVALLVPPSSEPSRFYPDRTAGRRLTMCLIG